MIYSTYNPFHNFQDKQPAGHHLCFHSEEFTTIQFQFELMNLQIHLLGSFLELPRTRSTLLASR